jgi:hypothetical protein
MSKAKHIDLSFYGEITSHPTEKDKIIVMIKNRPYYEKYINRSFKVGDNVLVSIQKRKYTRTLKQNRLWWGLVIEAIGDATGQDKDTVHEYIKAKFLPKKPITLGNGDIYEVQIGTSDLTKDEMTDLVSRVNAWLISEWGIVLPLAENLADSQELGNLDVV